MIEELDMNEEKKNNGPLYVILAILIVLAGILIYLLFIKKDKVEDIIIDDTITFGSTIINKSNATIKDNNVNITKGGNYILSGISDNACVKVDTLESVTIVLNDLELICPNNAVINIENSLSTTIVLNENSLNKLSDKTDSDQDAVIYSKSPLIINGLGILEINANVNEGIATVSEPITINGGIIIIDAKDDGINTGGDGELITINDGTIYINAKGDGIDSNKEIIFNGGKTFIMSTTNDNSPIDSDNGYVVNGGVIVALGNGMLESPSKNSTQRTVIFNLDNTILNNYLLSLKSIDKEIITFTSKENFKNFIISTPDIIDGNYHLYYKGESTGKLSYGIYYGGVFTKGEKIKISNNDTFKIDTIVNYFGEEIKNK